MPSMPSRRATSRTAEHVLHGLDSLLPAQMTCYGCYRTVNTHTHRLNLLPIPSESQQRFTRFELTCYIGTLNTVCAHGVVTSPRPAWSDSSPSIDQCPICAGGICCGCGIPTAPESLSGCLMPAYETSRHNSPGVTVLCPTCAENFRAYVDDIAYDGIPDGVGVDVDPRFGAPDIGRPLRAEPVGATASGYHCYSCLTAGLQSVGTHPLLANFRPEFLNSLNSSRGRPLTSITTSSGRTINVCDECRHPSSGNLKECATCNKIVEREGGRVAGIHDYSFKPRARFKGRETKGAPHFGTELEIETCDDRSAVAMSVAEMFGEDVYVKHDSSLHHGMELVTHPISFSKLKEVWTPDRMNFLEKYLHCHAEDTCGMHVHISKAPFIDNPNLWLAVMLWHYNNQSLMPSIAGRWNSHYAAMAPDTVAGVSRWAASSVRSVPYMPHGRHTWINTSPENTFELRYFSSTLKWDVLHARYQFLRALIEHMNIQLKPFSRDEGAVVSAANSIRVDAYSLVQFVMKHESKFPELVEKIPEWFGEVSDDAITIQDLRRCGEWSPSQAKRERYNEEASILEARAIDDQAYADDSARSSDGPRDNWDGPVAGDIIYNFESDPYFDSEDSDADDRLPPLDYAEPITNLPLADALQAATLQQVYGTSASNAGNIYYPNYSAIRASLTTPTRIGR